VLRPDLAICFLVDSEANQLSHGYRLDPGRELTRLPWSAAGDELRSLAEEAARRGEALLKPKVARAPGRSPGSDDEQVRSALCVPMKVNGRVVGVVEVLSFRPGHFSSADRQWLQTLAHQTALALENAHLYHEGRQRLAELVTLNVISQALISSLDLKEILTVITDHATWLLGVSAALVALRDEASGDLWCAAASGHGAHFIRDKRLAIGQGIVGWVVQHGEPALVPDVAQDPRFFGDFDKQSGFITRSILCVPLQTGGRIIGAIEALNKESGPFTQEDLRLLTSLAAPAATAIEHARLFEAEQHARRLADTLRAANLALTQTFDLDLELELLLDYLGQLVPFDSASVMLLEGNSRLVVRAARGYPGWAVSRQANPTTVDPQVYPALHTLVTTRKSVLISDTGQHANWRHPLGVGTVGSWLGVPLVAGGELIGLFSVEKSAANFFTEEHRKLAESLATQVAVSLQNARLFQQVRAGRERLQILARRLVEVQEAERLHIARELHDQAGQELTSLMVGLRLLEQEAADNERVADRVAELKRMTDGVLESLHQLAMDLRPASLDHLGLVAALRQYVETFSRRHRLPVQFEAVGLNGQRLPPTTEIALYRIVQEALTNVVRHAQATRADVLLERRGDRLIAIVEDDGVGFDPEAAMRSGRLGLLGIQERAEVLGGTMVIESSAGAGTTLVVEIPYDDSHPDRG